MAAVISRAHVLAVVEEYGAAWMAQDEERITLIFSKDAIYAEHPYDPARIYEGRAGIRDYWIRQVQGKQRDIQFTQHPGAMLLDGEKSSALVKWEASFGNLQADGSTALVEFVQVAMLTFDATSGLITRLEEYWTSKGKYEKGRRDPSKKKSKHKGRGPTHHATTGVPKKLEGAMFPCGALARTPDSSFVQGEYSW
jgi:hypothetical protein